MQNHHPALSFCLRDYSRKSGLCTFGAGMPGALQSFVRMQFRVP